MSETELICLAQEKNKPAFAELFRRYYAFLFHYLLRLTLDREMAEDLVQETMLKAWIHIGNYNGSSEFSTWLVTIAGRTYMDILRRKKHERKWMNERREMAKRQLIWQLQTENEEWSDLLESFSRLAPEVRIAVLLKHYYGYSYQEIADMTGEKSGTIKSRVHTGIQKLREGSGKNVRP